MKKKIMISLIILSFFSACHSQADSNGKEKNKKSIEYYYAEKYIEELKQVRYLLFQDYFQKIEVKNLKGKGHCVKKNVLDYPINIQEDIDSLLKSKIAFSEDLIFSFAIWERNTMPEGVIWCSDMNNYCDAFENFVKSHCSQAYLNRGSLLIQNGYSVGVFDSIQDGSTIIEFCTTEYLDNYPIILRIALKEKQVTQ